MELYDIIFYFFAAVTVASAAVVVFARKIVYSAFALLFTFFGVAGLYVLLNADFLAVTQLLVYVGGILVLILFAVMLTTNVISVDIKTRAVNIGPAVLAAAVAVGTLGGIVMMTDWYAGKQSTPVAVESTSGEIGAALISSHVLPFEIASVILLVAVVGAAMMARRERKN